MADMTDFEHQVEKVLRHAAEPSRPVDAVHVVELATASRWSVVTRRPRSGSAAPTEGGFSMFSAVKFVAAGVIVALFGGFLLAGVLTTPQGDEVVPAAATESPAQPEAAESGSSAPLSFTMPYMAQTKVPTVDFDEARRRYRGVALEGPIDSGDPRLSGTLWLIDNFDAYMDSQGRVAVGIVGIDNEDGTWRGTELGYARPYESSSYFQLILTGEGAHEGLSAILFFTDNGTDFDVEGMVFPGELPPMPEAPAE